MKQNLHNLKKSVELPNGATLGYTLIGEVVIIDKTGTRRVLDCDDAIKWLFYTVADDFPAPPVIPPLPPETAKAIRQSQERQEAQAAGSPLTGRINAAGNMVIALEDGTTVTLPSA